MSFNQLLQKLQKDYPQFKFKESDHFAWSSNLSQISYSPHNTEKEDVRLSNKLLHELAHAKLGHSNYQSDAELLKIESSAWTLAKDLCKEYDIKFSRKEQDDSLSSYIGWTSSRSQCPECKKNGLQTASAKFTCPNCSQNWKVGRSRFTRTYRQS